MFYNLKYIDWPMKWNDLWHEMTYDIEPCYNWPMTWNWTTEEVSSAEKREEVVCKIPQICSSTFFCLCNMLENIFVDAAHGC